MANTPMAAFRIDPEERKALVKLAEERGTTFSHALRAGARLYLASLSPHYHEEVKKAA